MNTEKRKIAVLSLSGGMDSTCLLVRLLNENYEVHCISFDYGQKHKFELERSKNNVNYLKSKGYIVQQHIVDLSSIMCLFHSSLISGNSEVPTGHYNQDNMKSTVVPNRNAIFSSIIYGYALSLAIKDDLDVKICLGIHSGDHSIYPDCRPEFKNAIEYAFKLGNWDSDKVEYYTPYLIYNKTSILQDMLKNCSSLNLDFDRILSNTLTSYNPDSEGRSSGTSGSDVERIEAFINIDRKDPIEYQEPWDTVVEKVKTILIEKENGPNN